MSEQAKIAHLGFIQNIITRMGTNSFLLKGWSLTLVAATIALSAKDSDGNFILIAYFPVFIFWWMDAFFLHQEKLYRKLYEDVSDEIVKSDNFTLNTIVVKDKVSTIYKVAFSKTIIPFHGIIIMVILFAMFFLTKK